MHQYLKPNSLKKLSLIQIEKIYSGISDYLEAIPTISNKSDSTQLIYPSLVESNTALSHRLFDPESSFCSDVTFYMMELEKLENTHLRLPDAFPSIKVNDPEPSTMQFIFTIPPRDQKIKFSIPDPDPDPDPDPSKNYQQGEPSWYLVKHTNSSTRNKETNPPAEYLLKLPSPYWPFKIYQNWISTTSPQSNTLIYYSDSNPPLEMKEKVVGINPQFSSVFILENENENSGEMTITEKFIQNLDSNPNDTSINEQTNSKSRILWDSKTHLLPLNEATKSLPNTDIPYQFHCSQSKNGHFIFITCIYPWSLDQYPDSSPTPFSRVFYFPLDPHLYPHFTSFVELTPDPANLSDLQFLECIDPQTLLSFSKKTGKVSFFKVNTSQSVTETTIAQFSFFIEQMKSSGYIVSNLEPFNNHLLVEFTPHTKITTMLEKRFYTFSLNTNTHQWKWIQLENSSFFTFGYNPFPDASEAILNYSDSVTPIKRLLFPLDLDRKNSTFTSGVTTKADPLIPLHFIKNDIVYQTSFTCPIPIRIISSRQRKEKKLNGKFLITCYGSYGMPPPTQYSPLFHLLLEQGWDIVIASLPGGSDNCSFDLLTPQDTQLAKINGLTSVIDYISTHYEPSNLSIYAESAAGIPVFNSVFDYLGIDSPISLHSPGSRIDTVILISPFANLYDTIIGPDPQTSSDLGLVEGLSFHDSSNSDFDALSSHSEVELDTKNDHLNFPEIHFPTLQDYTHGGSLNLVENHLLSSSFEIPEYGFPNDPLVQQLCSQICPLQRLERHLKLQSFRKGPSKKCQPTTQFLLFWGGRDSRVLPESGDKIQSLLGKVAPSTSITDWYAGHDSTCNPHDIQQFKNANIINFLENNDTK